MRDLENWQGCPPPGPVTLTGRFVQIVPYARDLHLNALWTAFGGARDINQLLRYFACPDFHDVEAYGDHIDHCARSGWVGQVFIDQKTGAVQGMANYMRADPQNGVVEVGGVAHSKAIQRSPITTEAHFLMARHVFETLGYRRYEWKCHNENSASKRAAERLGFTFEGIFRQLLVSRGKNRDTAWFSIIDEEWPSRAKAFEAWLSPDNFDHNGLQKKRLEDFRT